MRSIVKILLVVVMLVGIWAVYMSADFLASARHLEPQFRGDPSFYIASSFIGIVGVSFVGVALKAWPSKHSRWSLMRIRRRIEQSA